MEFHGYLSPPIPKMPKVNSAGLELAPLTRTIMSIVALFG
jgi:hypothetical protein